MDPVDNGSYSVALGRPALPRTAAAGPCRRVSTWHPKARLAQGTSAVGRWQRAALSINRHLNGSCLRIPKHLKAIHIKCLKKYTEASQRRRQRSETPQKGRQAWN